MDARFILIEVGKLMKETEGNTKALDKLGDKISTLDNTVKSAMLVGKVIVAVVVVLAGGVWWLGSALWPLKDKLFAVLTGT